VQTRSALAELLTERYTGADALVAKARDGEAVAVGRLVESRPNVVTLAFFATHRLPEIGLPLTRVIKRLLAEVVAAGVHRLECISSAEHTEAHRWLALFGLEPEGAAMRGFGKEGEAFISFAWVRDVRPLSS
jgi:hypothetical protein